MTLLDLTKLLVAPMEMSMAVLSSLMRARLGILFARARSRSIEGELFEIQWTTEMPRDLIEKVSRIFEFRISLRSRSYLSIQWSKGT
jgi:hypothetical protein